MLMSAERLSERPPRFSPTSPSWRGSCAESKRDFNSPRLRGAGLRLRDHGHLPGEDALELFVQVVQLEHVG